MCTSHSKGGLFSQFWGKCSRAHPLRFPEECCVVGPARSVFSPFFPTHKTERKLQRLQLLILRDPLGVFGFVIFVNQAHKFEKAREAH